MSDSEESIPDRGYYRRLQAAVEALLILKGVIAEGDVEKERNAMDARDHHAGARMIARAWVDASYKSRMLGDAAAAAHELGINIGAMRLIAVQNTPSLHNVVVCTLCSCYPRMLIGRPPEWYKSREYRSRIVREPRTVLKELGLVVPEHVVIRVHDSNAEMRYIVMPEQPAGTEGWSETALAELVTRDCLIGIELPQVA